MTNIDNKQLTLMRMNLRQLRVDFSQLNQKIDNLAQSLLTLTQLLVEENENDEPQPLSLDGEPLGGERDEQQPL